MSKNKNTFQLSALSQNDPGAADGNKLVCEVTANGPLRKGSSPVNKPVKLPIPPSESKKIETPTWYLETTKGENASFEIKISGPTGSKYPSKSIKVKQSDVQEWASVPFNDRENQIYQEGEYGIFGFAQEGPDGSIYTITAGVLNPRLYGN
ncbi:hypothetical protein C7447_10140 [Tenacibaculum adriaticum]|uniref:Uncharacterized protein n=1 Tax=Tenacibaculum adriaticum TaxID=413713 RepID=A0A5S5DUR3_9FLAO|nr:hypothetical protein [Tenacibaculum adriaticum]TYP99444.1 hypothetical protein C7447_10140 [Tenacibaculum adriaticum]